MTEIYADVVKRIFVKDGVFKLELFSSVAPGEGDDVSVARIVLPRTAVLELFERLRPLVDAGTSQMPTRSEWREADVEGVTLQTVRT